MTVNSYSSLCDDFYLDMYINTQMELPTGRDTILAFFERVQKQFPSMCCFYRRENNEYCLEEDSNLGQYRWVTLETDRIGSGVVNPSNFEMVYCQDRLVLELAPYMLSVSCLDIDSLDVTFTMDFDCAGSHDEVIAEALFGSTAFNCLLDLPSARAIGFSPAVVVALSDDCRTQGRISVASKTSLYEPGRRDQVGDESAPDVSGLADEAISLSFTVRQYRPTNEKFDAMKSFEYQCQLAQQLMAEKIVPHIVVPLVETIRQRRTAGLT
jgi:hypothetical protein